MSPTVVGKVVSDDDGDEQKDEPRSKDVGGHWLNRNGRPGWDRLSVFWAQLWIGG